MTRRSRGTITVSTSWLDPVTDDEVDIEVACSVTGGARAYYDRNYGPQPAEGPEVEIVSAVGADGNDYREAIEEDAAWFDRVAEDAIEAAGDADECAREDAAEARADAARDERRGI